MSASPAETRKARSFLYSHSKTGFGIPPRRFASAAKELNVGFRELLRWISQMYAGGQNMSEFRLGAIRAAAQGESDAQSQ